MTSIKTAKCSQISMSSKMIKLSPILHRGVNLQNLFSGSILHIQWLLIIDFELLRHGVVKCILYYTKGPSIYYVKKKMGGCGQMLMFAAKVGEAKHCCEQKRKIKVNG